MNRRVKQVAAVMLAGAMAATMIPVQAGAEEGEKVKIKIAWWGGQSRHEYTQKLLELYQESHPNVEFEGVPSGWDGYFDKLSTQAASGSMPDIVQMDYMYISTYANNQSVADLAEYVEDGTIDVTDIDEKLMASGNIGGRLAGIPLSSSIITVGYNPQVIADAGVEKPTNDWTWADYVDMSEQISNKTGKPSAMISSGAVGDTIVFHYWVRQHGASLFNEEGTGLGYEDDQVCADYFQMWKDMIDKNAFTDPDEYAQIQTLGQEAGPVVTGDAATVFDWNNYSARVSVANDTIKLVTPPLADNSDNKGLWIKPGMYFSVAETSEVKKECAEFINWFVNSEEANDIIMAERGTPVSSAIREYMINSGKMSPQQVDMFEYVDLAAEFCGDTPAPEPSGIAEVNEAFSNAGNSVFYGQATAEEAAASFREEANLILERNNRK
ncbi:MAG: extracellular solute-binding protein [Lachnospiraceae bacterium]|nr:extracellular solute-binding protein [Lachnospiraceae bacterium]